MMLRQNYRNVLTGRIAVSVATLCLMTTAGQRVLGSDALGEPAKGWTPESVCAALAWREGRLSKCSFTFTEDCRMVRVGVPGEVPLTTTEVTVRRADGAMLLDQVEINHHEPLLNVDHAMQLWDGKICRWRGTRRLSATKSQLQGGVSATEPPVLRDLSLFTFLGLRMAGSDLPWSKWIGQMLATKGSEARITESFDNGDQCVTLAVRPGDSTEDYCFTFLPGKDFVTRDLDVDVRPGADAGKFSGKSHCTRFQQFDGLWMPVEIRVRNANPEVANMIKCLVKAFSLTAPAQAEMEVDFPVGTHVMDEIGMQHYVILPQGKREYQRYFDVNTGKIIEPATEPTTQP